MNNKLLNAIKTHMDRVTMLEEVMTIALQAMEEYKFGFAIDAAETILELSDNITERMAAEFIITLCNEQNCHEIDCTLETVYEYDRRCTRNILIQRNNKAYQNLLKTCDDFSANLKRIMARL